MPNRHNTYLIISHSASSHKMKKYFPHILLVCMLGLFASCQKEGDNVLSFTPLLVLDSINKTEITEFQDSIILYINFEDGNGDLGRQDPDSNSLSIKDARLELPEFYHIPPIIPEDEKLQTIGRFRVFIPTLFILGSENQERTSISIRVKDKAGNWSNQITSPEIIINKEE